MAFGRGWPAVYPEVDGLRNRFGLFWLPDSAPCSPRPTVAGRSDTEICNVAGKHCESGDVIVRDAPLPDPAPGDVLVTPVTGAYGYSMANNYNGVPRPPVIFCRDGNARVVVRRETYADLSRRDVDDLVAGAR